MDIIGLGFGSVVAVGFLMWGDHYWRRRCYFLGVLIGGVGAAIAALTLLVLFSSSARGAEPCLTVAPSRSIVTAFPTGNPQTLHVDVTNCVRVIVIRPPQPLPPEDSDAQ